MDNYLTENIDTVIFDIGKVLIHSNMYHTKSGEIQGSFE